MVQPCCGSSLKQGTKFLAILSMALSVTASLVSGVYLLLIAASTFKSDPLANKDEIPIPPDDGCIDSIIPEPLMIIIILVMAVFNLFLSIMLFIGAEQENLRVCLFWWRISSILCLIDIGLLIISVIVCTANVTDLVINSAEILRSLYELWVVHAFMAELRQKQHESTSGGGRSREHVNMA